MNKNKIASIISISIVAALYVILTISVSSISYYSIQLRVSEVLLVLVLFNKKYSISVVLGCFIANLLSPYFIWDVMFGTIGSALSVLFVYLINKKWSLLVFPPIFNGIFVGLEIFFINGLPSLYSILTVMAGEFIVMIIAYLAHILISTNKDFVEFLKSK